MASAAPGVDGRPGSLLDILGRQGPRDFQCAQSFEFVSQTSAETFPMSALRRRLQQQRPAQRTRPDTY
ncbi:unnamed protein product, partial [Nesidiocoris tenuis]